MVCKDELCASFKSLRSADRIELLCGMLQLCIPLELRFIGSCLEELARKDYVELSEFETKANDCSCLQEVATSTCKKGLIHAGVLNIYLSLLHSDNTACARSLFSVLNELKNSFELQLDQEDDSLTDLLADSNFMDDVILLFTMASYHPAFTFCQRLQLYKSCKSIKESLKEAFKRIPSYDICLPVLANVAIVPDGDSPDFLSQSYVKEVSLSSYKINTTERIHEYQIKISWCDGTTTELWKTYQELRSFHSSLLRLFPDDAGAHRQERNIPFLPQEQPSRTEQEMVELIKDYFKKLSTMPKNILRCEPMTEFLRDHSTSESVDESSVVTFNGQSHDIPCKVIKSFDDSTSSGPGSTSHSTAELQNLELVRASDPVDLPVTPPVPLLSPDPQEQPPIHLPPMRCSLPQTVSSQFLPFPSGVNNLFSKPLQPQFDMRVVNNCNDDIKQRPANTDQKLPISCNGLISGDYTAAMNSQETFVYPFFNGMRMPMFDPYLYQFMLPNKNMAVDSFTPSFTGNESNPDSDVLENDTIKNAEALKPQSEISSHTLMTFLPPDNMHICSPNCNHLGRGDSRHCGSPATTDATFLRLSTVVTTVGTVSSAPVAVQTTTTSVRTARPILGAFSNQSSNSTTAQNHDDATRRCSILGSEAHPSSGTAARSDQNAQVSTGSTISRSLSLGAIVATSIPTSTNLPSIAAAAPQQAPSFPTYHPNFPVDQQFGVPVPAPGFNLPFDHNFFQNSAVFGSAGITPTLPMQPLPANTACACGVCPNCLQGLHLVNMPSMPPYPYGYPNVVCFPQMYYPSNDLAASRFPLPNLLPGGMLSPPYMYGLMNNVTFQPQAGATQPPTPATVPQSAQVLQSPVNSSVQNLKMTSKVYCHNCGAFGHDADACSEPIMMPIGQAAQFKLKPMPVSKPE